jgi:hypothetical protein
MKAKKMQYGGVKKMQKGGSKLISTVKGTSAINTKLNPKKIIETGFNYNTELAKKQKADAAAKVAKADAAKRAAAKIASGKKVKAVIEGITRDNPKKTPVKPKATTQYKPVGSAKVSITNSKIKIEPNLGKNSSSVKTPVKTPAGKTVSEIWKEKTGTSWSEAKKQGLTDGSMKANLALLAKLKSGSFDKKNQSPAKMETVKATDMKVSSTGPTKLAGVGDNKGFEQPTENELINKPGSGAKKKKGGIIKTKKK